MKKSSENFWRASGAQKKGFPNFSPAAGFFSLWRHWKPLKPLKNVNFLTFFPKNRKIFQKRDPKIFRLRRAFFRKCPRSIFRKSSVKVGGVKNILPPPPPYDGVCNVVNPWIIKVSEKVDFPQTSLLHSKLDFLKSCCVFFNSLRSWKKLETWLQKPISRYTKKLFYF